MILLVIFYQNVIFLNMLYTLHTIWYHYYIFQLLELYASGKLKPGLNIPVEDDKIFINNIVSINLNYYNHKRFWLTGSTKTNGVAASLEWNIKIFKKQVGKILRCEHIKFPVSMHNF